MEAHGSSTAPNGQLLGFSNDSAMDASSDAQSSLPSHHGAGSRPKHFEPEMTFIIVGVRGAGKSTLAVMAASAMKRKVIDMEVAFKGATGFRSSDYKAEHGVQDLQIKQAKVLEQILQENRLGAIVVCSWVERRVQELLQLATLTNPVIHIVRDADAIQKHFKIADADRAQSLVDMSNTFFRLCASFEFFNVSEKQAGSSATETIQTPPSRPAARYMSLKQAERHWLKFLSLIYPPGSIPFAESAFPLADVPPEDRQFTYALSVELDDILSGTIDIEEEIVGADLVQLAIESSYVGVGPPTASLKTGMTKAIGIIRRSTQLPILIHIVPKIIEGHMLSAHYCSLFGHARRLVPEMMTVSLRLHEIEFMPLLAARQYTNIIADYCATAEEKLDDYEVWTSLYKRAVRAKCHMVRLIHPATKLSDNFAVAQFRQETAALSTPHVPLIAYASGPLGRHSACFNPVLTLVKPSNPKTNLLKNASIERLPSLTANQATRALFASYIYDSMKLYVFGINVEYSMSPAMHNAALRACGVPHQYELRSTDSLSKIQHLIEDPHFGGASIGLPFKVEVIALTHSLSKHARAIGAVNTLIPIRHLNDDGSIPTGADFFRHINRSGPVKAFYGENTDWIGIRACIRRGLSPANAVVPKSCGLVIGAGGMARAAVYAMLQAGVKNITIHNRSPENADKLVSHFKQLLARTDSGLPRSSGEIQFQVVEFLTQPWPKTWRLPTIVISCIPTHPIGDTEAPNFTMPDFLLENKTGGVIIELGYKTLDTPLLAQARSRASSGWVAMDGLDLLPEQGFAQFELFTGRRAPKRIMRRDLLKAYAEQQGQSNLGELRHRLQSITEQDS